MRVVVDTNLWISFLFGKQGAGLLPLIQKGRVQVATDARQIAEIEEVTSVRGIMTVPYHLSCGRSPTGSTRPSLLPR